MCCLHTQLFGSMSTQPGFAWFLMFFRLDLVSLMTVNVSCPSKGRKAVSTKLFVKYTKVKYINRVEQYFFWIFTKYREANNNNNASHPRQLG